MDLIRLGKDYNTELINSKEMKIMSFWGVLALTASLLSCNNKITSLSDGQEVVGSGVKADMVLQWNNEKQVMDGFGVAQAGWADYLYAHHKRDEVMDVLFGRDGLRLSILRGEVFPHYNEQTFNMDEAIDMPLDDPLFDIDYNGLGNQAAKEEALRKGQLWITKKAKEVYGVDKLMFSTWTPPAYMKSNGKTSKGSLKSKYYPAFAEYLSNFCDAYTRAGLPVYAISPVNEPEYAAPWNSCRWLPGKGTLGEFIVDHFGPKMAQTHPQTKIIFGENATWSGILGFIMGAKNYVHGILKLKDDITKYPLIAAGHGYLDPVTKKEPKIVPFTKAEENGIPVWLTEISDPYEKYDPSMTSGLTWAKRFHRYLCEANVNAIVWWAGALPDSGTTEGLIYINKNRDDYEVSKRCEVFGNFSRYIPLGSRRIAIAYDTEKGYLASAYKLDKSFTLVAINPSSTQQTLTLAAEQVQMNGPLQGYLTDETAKWSPMKPLLPQNQCYILTLPARSVVSFVGRVE